MGTLTVWKFDSAEGADTATKILQDLASQNLIKIHDAATVSWEPGKRKPKTRQLNNLAGAGALTGSLQDVGIDDAFINRIRDEVTPGTSALFVMTSEAVMDKVRDAFSGERPELIFTYLSDDQEAAIREVFAD